MWHFSTLPGCSNGGTCVCNCTDCYGFKGRYVFDSVKNALRMRTDIVRNDLEWFVAEIIREIRKHKIQFVRIHVTGDFFSADYVKAWNTIVKACPDVQFWTYTKTYGYSWDAELHELNNSHNCNIVRSVVKGCGFNFGHCDYILDTYYKLVSEGKNPYICKCGVDDTVQCSNCHKCADREYVLFIEHSTDYKAKKDPLFPTISKVVLAQN